MYSPKKGDIRDYIASVDRTQLAYAEIQQTNLRSNQQGANEMNKLLQEGTKNLETAFRDLLQEGNEKPIVPLEYVLKSKRDWNKSLCHRPLTFTQKSRSPCFQRRNYQNCA